MRISALVVVAMAFAFDAGPVATPPKPLGSSSVQPDVRAPVIGELRVEELSDTSARVVVEVDRRGGGNIPVHAELLVPAGVNVVEGQTSWLEHGDPAQAARREFRISFLTVPTEPIALVLTGRTASMGVHARIQVRLMEPVPAPISEPRGPLLEVGRLRLGNSVSMTSRPDLIPTSPGFDATTQQ